jgi:putative ABC transport system ATP-binding protein
MSTSSQPTSSVPDGHHTAETFIRLDGVERRYQRGAQAVVVLSGLDLAIERGEFVALMGPSGSGKSTLLNLIGGLDRPDAGTVSVNGDALQKLNERALTDWRAIHVGFVFQSYHLLPVLSARENVELPLLLTRLTSKERRKHASIALDAVGLSDRAEHLPDELSGGQQQRVAIARAIVTDPSLIVCDEPTGGLDRATATEILTLLQALNTQQGKTIVMVTHDSQAAAFSGRCLHMDKGVLVGAQRGAA